MSQLTRTAIADDAPCADAEVTAVHEIGDEPATEDVETEKDEVQEGEDEVQEDEWEWED